MILETDHEAFPVPRAPSKGGALNHLGIFEKALTANFVPFHFHPLT